MGLSIINALANAYNGPVGQKKSRPPSPGRYFFCILIHFSSATTPNIQDCHAKCRPSYHFLSQKTESITIEQEVGTPKTIVFSRSSLISLTQFCYSFVLVAESKMLSKALLVHNPNSTGFLGSLAFSARYSLLWRTLSIVVRVVPKSFMICAS